MPDLTQAAAIVLAAGRSQRFGHENKLLAQFEGRSLIDHCLEVVQAAGLRQVVVVTGQDREEISARAAERGFLSAHNAQYQRGMGSSIAVGAIALGDYNGPVFVVPSDMPRIPPQIFGILLHCLQADNEIARPVYNKHPGHPVLFGANYLPALSKLDGDEGARAIIAGNYDQLRTIDVDDEGVVYDLDTPSAFPK